MTEQELRQLRRIDLLKLLATQDRENKQLRWQLNQARKELENWQIVLDQAGSIAEATLQLNVILRAAATAQYLKNIRQYSPHDAELTLEQTTQSSGKKEPD